MNKIQETVLEGATAPDISIDDYAAKFASDRAIGPSLMEYTTRLVEDTGRWEPNEELGYEVKTQWQTKQPHNFKGLICFDNEDGSTFQRKPMNPTLRENGKPDKYLTPTGAGSRAFFPAIDPATRSKIAEFQGVKIPPDVPIWEFVQTSKLPLIISEGPKNLAILSHGGIAIALTGVDGGYRRNKKIDGEKVRLESPELIADLIPFVTGGREIYLAFDCDSKPETADRVGRSTNLFAGLLEAAGAIVKIVTWDNQGGLCKGPDDLIKEGSHLWDEAFLAARSLKEWRKAIRKASSPLSYITKDGDEKLQPVSKSADYLAKIWGQKLVWNPTSESFLEYGAEHGGLWTEEPEIAIQARIQGEVRATGVGHGADYISGVIKLLKGCLVARSFEESLGLLPLKNGVLDLATRELSPHDPKYRFCWQLPYEYSPLMTCEPILEWLRFTQDDDEQRVQMLRAYLKAIVCGRTDLQRFLELIGPGGTGKSTFINLAIALIGITNCHVTSLDRLENNRFETALIYRKKLVYITDSEKYGGGVSVLKALTGQDPLPYEQKYKKAQTSFIPKAMVALASNEPIASSDYTSGMKRRKLSDPFTRLVAPGDRRNLIEISRTEVSGEFAPHLPGLLNWVLEMPDSEMVKLVVDTDKNVPSLADFSKQNLIETNSLAEWLDGQCVWANGIQTPIGNLPKGSRITDGDVSMAHYPKADIWLYPNYVRFCEQSGAKPLSVKRFSPLLLDLCNSQLGRSEVVKGTNRACSYIGGIALREGGYADKPRPISEPQETVKQTPEQIWESIPDDQKAEAKQIIEQVWEAESWSDEDLRDMAFSWTNTVPKPVRDQVSRYLKASERGLTMVNRMAKLVREVAHVA